MKKIEPQLKEVLEILSLANESVEAAKKFREFNKLSNKIYVPAENLLKTCCDVLGKFGLKQVESNFDPLLAVETLRDGAVYTVLNMKKFKKEWTILDANAFNTLYLCTSSLQKLERLLKK